MNLPTRKQQFINGKENIREKVGVISNTHTLVVCFSCPIVGPNSPHKCYKLTSKRLPTANPSKATITTNMNV
jgi:hypothetical protein